MAATLRPIIVVRTNSGRVLTIQRRNAKYRDQSNNRDMRSRTTTRQGADRSARLNKERCLDNQSPSPEEKLRLDALVSVRLQSPSPPQPLVLKYPRFTDLYGWGAGGSLDPEIIPGALPAIPSPVCQDLLRTPPHDDSPFCCTPEQQPDYSPDLDSP